MSLKSNNSALTMVELVLAILLVNVVILTGLSMELGMRKIFTGTDITTEINNEGVAIMSLVAKKINGGIGAEAIPGWSPYSVGILADGSKWWAIRQDTNGDGFIDVATVDVPCAFRYFGPGTGVNYGKIFYYNNVSNVNTMTPTLILTTHCINSPIVSPGFDISSPSAPGPGVPPLGYSIVKLRLRKNISAGINGSNPELYFVTRAEYLSTSMG